MRVVSNWSNHQYIKQPDNTKSSKNTAVSLHNDKRAGFNLKKSTAWMQARHANRSHLVGP